MAWIFDAPGNEKDFPDPGKWHDTMAAEARGIVVELVATVLRKRASKVTQSEVETLAPQLAYVDPISQPPTDAGETLPSAPWGGFPRAVRRRAPWAEFKPTEGDPEGVHRAVEHLGDEDHRPGVFVDSDDNILHLPVRDRQDEYLEWSGRRDANGKLTKITFVAEGYDYYSKLFEHDECRVLELYRDCTEDSTIKVDDLRARNGIYRRLPNGSKLAVVEAGGFNPRNRFNINPGIVHLSHRANSLGAEVNLAGVSGIARSKADGARLNGNDAEELLCCCEGGGPNRNSDPAIAQQAYSQVLQNYRFTLANPVGLYIAGVEHHRLLTSAGNELPPEWWRPLRGHGFGDQLQSRVLRLELAPPAGESLTLSDLTVDGEPVRFAGQLADIVLVHLFVTRWKRPDNSVGPIVPCSGTCCRKQGTEQLVITREACAEGFDLAFPGLIKSSPSAAAVATLSAPPGISHLKAVR